MEDGWRGNPSMKKANGSVENNESKSELFTIKTVGYEQSTNLSTNESTNLSTGSIILPQYPI